MQFEFYQKATGLNMVDDIKWANNENSKKEFDIGLRNSAIRSQHAQIDSEKTIFIDSSHYVYEQLEKVALNLLPPLIPSFSSNDNDSLKRIKYFYSIYPWKYDSDKNDSIAIFDFLRNLSLACNIVKFNYREFNFILLNSITGKLRFDIQNMIDYEGGLETILPKHLINIILACKNDLTPISFYREKFYNYTPKYSRCKLTEIFGDLNYLKRRGDISSIDYFDRICRILPTNFSLELRQRYLLVKKENINANPPTSIDILLYLSPSIDLINDELRKKYMFEGYHEKSRESHFCVYSVCEMENDLKLENGKYFKQHNDMESPRKNSYLDNAQPSLLSTKSKHNPKWLRKSKNFHKKYKFVDYPDPTAVKLDETKLVEGRLLLNCSISGSSLSFFIDPGSCESVLSLDYLKQLCPDFEISTNIRNRIRNFYQANRKSLLIDFMIKIPVQIQSHVYNINVNITKSKGIAVLGRNFFQATGLEIQFNKKGYFAKFTKSSSNQTAYSLSHESVYKKK